MGEPSTDDVQLAQRIYAEWDQGRGTSKSALEIREWGDGTAHGRRFDRFIRQTLGLSTNRRSKQSDRIVDLEHQLRRAGHLPIGTVAEPWQVQLQHARDAALAAVRVWNDPTAVFRTGSFALLLVTAWNSVAIAVLQKKAAEWRELDDDGQPKLKDGEPKARDTKILVGAAFEGASNDALRRNVQWWIDLRNLVAHRHIPALDVVTIPYAQAALLNFEHVVAGEFGDEYALGSVLSVPLQIAGFRDPGFLGSMRQLQAALPLDIQSFLARADAVPDEILADPRYTLRVAFVPVIPASGRRPDVVAYFIRPEDAGALPEELRDALVMSKLAAPPRPHLNAKRVVEQVSAAIPHKFNVHLHTLASRRLKVRPKTSQTDQSKTDIGYCEYVQAVKVYLYNEAWVARLIAELASSDGFLSATGCEPVPREN